jgi:Family of unknown function (DUF5995)
VTRDVRQAVAGPAFRDTRFVSELDVVFANVYFAAIAEGESMCLVRRRRGVRCYGAERSAGLPDCSSRSRAWTRTSTAIPQGIVEVFTALGGDPTSDATRRQDVESVNALRERVEGEVKADFSIDVIGAVDVLAGRVDDVAATWNVRVARHADWTNAEVLWTLQRIPHVRAAFFETLDRSTGLAGREVLPPLAMDAAECLRSDRRARAV